MATSAMEESIDTNDLSLAKFTCFSEATDLQEIISSFNSLCNEIDIDPYSETEGFYASMKEKLQQWRCKALWELLDKRASMEEYRNGSSCKGKRVLVVGAGPVGLRFAIEASLLGASVYVVEKRSSFSRNNVLHLWPFLIDDLKSLGAKKFYGKFCAGAIDHIGIKILQSLLLKISLLLGVKVYFPVSFQDYIEPQSNSTGWKILVSPDTNQLSSKTYDAIIAADGKQYSVRGFQTKEFRAKLAIAITVNFVNGNTQQEKGVEEISGVSYIYNQSFFNDLKQAHGIELENIVYYKDETHYFVMTAKKSSLLEKGVLKRDYKDPDMLLSQRNISHSSLEAYATEAATYSTKDKLGRLQFASNHRGENDVAIFDFTSLFASVNACRIMERKGKRLLLCQIGDSLLEPFWPTGSGLARGFLGGFDAAWMLKKFSEGEETPLKLIEEREALYHLLPSTTPEKLQKKTSAYSIDPQTRYPQLNVIPTSDVSYLYDSDTLPAQTRVIEQQRPTNVPKVKRYHSIEGRSPKRSIQQVRPVKPPLDVIRASLSPPPPPPHSSPSHPPPSNPPTPLIPSLSQEYEIIEKPEEPITISRKKSTSDFSLIKFAKMLFLGQRGSKAGTPERGATPEGRTPEHKRSGRGKERKVSKSKSPGRAKKRKSQSIEADPPRDKQRGHINTSTPSPSHSSRPKESPAHKTNKTSIGPSTSGTKSSTNTTNTGGVGTGTNTGTPSAVQNLTRLYEGHSVDPLASSPRSSSPGGNMSSRRPVASGTVASVIKKLEEKGGESVDYELEGINVEEESINVEGESNVGEGIGERRVATDDVQVEEVVQYDAVESDDYPMNESLMESVSIVLDHEEKEEEEEEVIMVPKGRSYTLSESTQFNCLRHKKDIDEFTIVTRMDRRKSKDDSLIHIQSNTSIVPLHTPQWLQKFTDSLTKSLESLREEASDLLTAKTALDIINFAFSNIISDPEEDTYRRIRSTSDHFHDRVYKYRPAQEFMWLSGWVEVGEYLVLPLHQQLEVPKKVLDRQLEIVGLKLQSSHINSILLSKGRISHDERTQSYNYTDSIVNEALKKSKRDQSVMMATALKEMVTKTETDKDAVKASEETDTGRVTREEEKIMMESASQAREWWERKLERRPSTYSLYFQHDELDDMKLIANTELVSSYKGMVSERIKAFQPSSSEYSSSEEEDEDEDEQNEEEQLEEFSVSVQSLGASETQALSKSVKIWEERSQGIDVTGSSDQSSPVKNISLTYGDESEAHLKWLEATKASERILQLKQQKE